MKEQRLLTSSIKFLRGRMKADETGYEMRTVRTELTVKPLEDKMRRYKANWRKEHPSKMGLRNVDNGK